jgi:hypothetical protein
MESGYDYLSNADVQRRTSVLKTVDSKDLHSKFDQEQHEGQKHHHSLPWLADQSILSFLND